MSIRTTMLSGASGLAAASAGIAATSQNVANATTPGYSRRDVAQRAADPLVGRVVLGQGVNVEGFTRATNERVVEQQIDAGADLARAETREQSLAPLEVYLDPVDGTGPRTAMGAFFDALTASARDPADAGLRRDVVAQGGSMARVFNRTAEALSAAESGQDRTIRGGVDDLNAILEEVSVINVKIVAAGGNLRAGDMADRRDQLMREAGKLAGVELDIQPDGTATGRIAGHVVVSGADVRPLSVQADGSITVPVGEGAITVDDKLNGQMGGLVQARTATRTMRTDLDDTVSGLADALNTASAGGYDRNGVAGADMLDYDPSAPGATVNFAISDPDELAYADGALALAGDGGNLARMMAVENTAVVGTQTAAESMSALTSALGTNIRNSRAEAAQSDAILLDLDELNASLSGVNLDEEATNLLTYQAAYQAAAKVVQTADQLMGVLMEMV